MTRGAAGALLLSILAALPVASGAQTPGAAGRQPSATTTPTRPVTTAPDPGPVTAETSPPAPRDSAEPDAPAADTAPPPAPERTAAPESEAPPPARPAEPMPLANPATDATPVPGSVTVPEPEGFHGEPYRSKVPASLRGAEVIEDAAAHALWRAGIPFLDLLPTAVKPANLPAGTLWRDPPRDTIPGAIWLANTGYDALDPATEAYFFDALAAASQGRMDAPLVFFCKADCWMSWNGAKRAIARGYSRVFWYPRGTDGWTAGGWPLEAARPYAAPSKP